jgi:hypothetical protein
MLQSQAILNSKHLCVYTQCLQIWCLCDASSPSAGACVLSAHLVCSPLTQQSAAVSKGDGAACSVSACRCRRPYSKASSCTYNPSLQSWCSTLCALSAASALRSPSSRQLSAKVTGPPAAWPALNRSSSHSCDQQQQQQQQQCNTALRSTAVVPTRSAVARDLRLQAAGLCWCMGLLQNAHC